ncbi:group II intron maturase-specific domain-containing protein [Burkholderia sp. AW49-1]
MYHRHLVSKSPFTSVDAHIWRLLWKWAMRRHPTKGAGWAKNKYFRVGGTVPGRLLPSPKPTE